MPEGAQPSRLDRVAQAVVAGLQALRGDEPCTEALVEVFRSSLGTVERKVLAICVADAMGADERAALTDVLNEDMARTVKDMRFTTRATYRHAIAMAVLAEDQARVEVLKSTLESKESAWAAEDGRQA